MYTTFARRIGFLLLATTLPAALSQVASAATIGLKVETVEATGSSIEARITTEPCEGLGALQFDLTYDPTVVEPELVEPGSGLPNGLVEFRVKMPGVLAIALISSAPINGSGELLKVRFKPVAAVGGSTTLGIQGEAAWDFENNLEMLVLAQPGTLILTPSAPSTASAPSSSLTIPLVIGVVVLVLAILIAGLAKRGRTLRTATTARDASSPSEGGFCEQCGARHDAGTRFCPECGRAVDPSA